MAAQANASVECSINLLNVDFFCRSTNATVWSSTGFSYTTAQPGTPFQVAVAGASWHYAEIHFDVPSGYTLYEYVGSQIQPATTHRTQDYSDSSGNPSSGVEKFTMVMLPTDGTQMLSAGQATAPTTGTIVWQVALGSLSNGAPAGALQLRQSDITASTFTTDLLQFANPDSSEVSIYSDAQLGSPYGSSMRVLSTPQALVILRPRGGGVYSIEFYDPTYFVVWGEDNYFHVYDYSGTLQDGSVEYIYLVSQLSDGSLGISYYEGILNSPDLKRTWNVTHPNGGNWGMVQDDLIRKVTETSVTNPAGDRVATTVVTSEDGSTIAKKVQKTYHVYPWGLEELTSSVLDPDNQRLTTSYTYGTDPSVSSYGKLLSVSNPDGTWVAYSYLNDVPHWGELSAVMHPWQDGGTTAATANATNCDCTTYNYALEAPRIGFFIDYPAGSSRQVNGTMVSQEIVSLAFSNAATGQPICTKTVQDYASASVVQNSVVAVYNHTADDDHRGHLYFQKNPDGTQVSALTYRGAFLDYGDNNASTFQLWGSNQAVGEYHFHGFTTNIAGSVLVNAWNSQAITPIYMVPNKSLIDLYVYDSNGRIGTLAQYIFTGSSGGVAQFQFLTRDNRTYGPAGQLVGSSKTNNYYFYNAYPDFGVAPVWTTGPDGVYTSRGLDNVGYPLESVRAAAPGYSGYPAIPAKYTFDSYNAAEQLVSERVSDNGSLNIVTTHQYDLAGQVTQDVQEATSANPLTTTYAYAYPTGSSTAGLTVTTTLPGGFTKIVQNHLDGSSGWVTGTAVVNQYTANTVNADGTISQTTYTLRSSDLGAPTSAPRWSRVTNDWLGRKIREESPAPGGGIFTKSYAYNSSGQLTVTSETGKANMLTAYNIYAEPYQTGLDLNGNGTLDLASSDRITETDITYTQDSNQAWWQVTTTLGWNQVGSATPFTKSIVKSRFNRFGGTNLQSETVSTDTYGNVTDSTVGVDQTNKVVTKTTVLPNSTAHQIEIDYNGLKIQNQTAQNLVYQYHYDAIERLTDSIDPRTGDSTTGYVSNSSRVAWTKDPAGNQTSDTYESGTGRLATVTDSAGSTSYNSYNSRSQIIRSWGANTYPVEYVFDDYGEKTQQHTFRTAGVDWTQSTWPGSPGTIDVTSWAYDPATATLLSKTDAAGQSVNYTYNPRSQLATRTWSRGVVTTYTYDSNTNEQTGISYSDGTAGLTYTYDRLGHNNSVVQVFSGYSLTSQLQYNASGKLTQETLDPTYFGGRALTYLLDTTGTGTLGRTIGYQLGTNATPAGEQNVAYTYDAYNRLDSVGLAGGPTFTYTFIGNSNLIGAIADTAAGGAWAETRSWDSQRDLLTSIQTTVGGSLQGGFSYTYDSLARRTSKVVTGAIFSRYPAAGLTDAYSYDSRSQVTGAQTYQSTSPSSTTTAMLGRSFAYAYDSIGSRTTSSVDGVGTSYTNNSLNQLVSRSIPAQYTVSGFAPAGATVTVNGAVLSASQIQGQYYLQNFTADNASGPLWILAQCVSSYGGTISKNAFIPQSPEAFAYDADGNLLSDGRWHYWWDAENRLIAMETYGNQTGDSSAVWNSGVPRQHIAFTYDYQGRRVDKAVATWNGSGFAVTSETRFVYEQWNLVSDYVVSGSILTLSHSNLWGIDLSGHLHRAGGVGGLLAVVTASGAQELTIYDANGNVFGLVDRTTTQLTAEYEYSPFGETLRATGAYAQLSPWRFSSKYADTETGLLYYGIRYYQSAIGRWLGRDPAAENGGLHLYAFVNNQAINSYDGRGNIAMKTNGRQNVILPIVQGTSNPTVVGKIPVRNIPHPILPSNPIVYTPPEDDGEEHAQEQQLADQHSTWDGGGIDGNEAIDFGFAGNAMLASAAGYLQSALQQYASSMVPIGTVTIGALKVIGYSDPNSGVIVLAVGSAPSVAGTSAPNGTANQSSVLEGVLGGAWTTTVGVASTVGGVLLLSPPAEAATAGADTPLGIAGVVNGVAQIGLGVTKIISSLTGGLSDVPTSNGDVVTIATGSKSLGLVYDLGTGGNPIKQPNNIWDVIGQIDTGKTVVQQATGP